MFQNLAIKSTKIAPQKSIMLFMLCEISFYKSSIFHPPPPRESLNQVNILYTYTSYCIVLVQCTAPHNYWQSDVRRQSDVFLKDFLLTVTPRQTQKMAPIFNFFFLNIFTVSRFMYISTIFFGYFVPYSSFKCPRAL